MAKNKEKDSKNKRHFFKDFKAELKKVIWPTPKQVVNNTIAVITIVLIVTAIVLVLDLAFEGLNTYGINKLKEAVSANNETTQNETVDNTTEGTENNTVEDEANTTSTEENNTTTENSTQEDTNNTVEE